MIYYAAYGMLTNQDIIGDADYIGNGKISGYEFEFAYYANAFKSSNTIDVVVWNITPEKLSELDQMEGYPDFYTRVKVRCQVDGQTIPVWLYTMTNESRAEMVGNPPPIQYMRNVTAGYQHAKISTNQISNALRALR